MQYVWDHIEEIKEKIKQHTILLLMLDFDGTLSPLADHPQKAVMSPETKDILEKLNKKDTLYLAVISGRQLDVLKEKVGIPHITYSGTHGFAHEIFGKMHTYQLTKTQQTAHEKLHQQLENLCKKYGGSWVEDKGVMLVVHYRLVKDDEKENLRKEFDKLMQEYTAQKIFFITYGKNVFEIKPTDAIHKGTFAKALITKVEEKEKTTPCVIYIGDDATDENVFKTLPDSITIRVGTTEESKANYSLIDNDTEDVFRFLTWLNKNI